MTHPTQQRIDLSLFTQNRCTECPCSQCVRPLSGEMLKSPRQVHGIARDFWEVIKSWWQSSWTGCVLSTEVTEHPCPSARRDYSKGQCLWIREQIYPSSLQNCEKWVSVWKASSRLSFFYSSPDRTGQNLVAEEFLLAPSSWYFSSPGQGRTKSHNTKWECSNHSPCSSFLGSPPQWEQRKSRRWRREESWPGASSTSSLYSPFYNSWTRFTWFYN